MGGIALQGRSAAPALLLVVLALLTTACMPSSEAAATPEGTEVISPHWKAAMRPEHFEGHPDGGEVLTAVPPFIHRVWPSMDYWIYEPLRIAPRRMLVIYLHGADQTPITAAQGVRWNELADREGVIVVYPHGPGDNWGWGESTVLGRGAGAVESVARITQLMQQRYGIGPERTFIAGASAGAITATMMAAMYADLYSGVMSVMGCSYNCADPAGVEAYQAMGANAKVMPAFLVHGSQDPIFNPSLALMADTQWVGTNDLADDGLADGSVSPVPELDSSNLQAPEASYPYLAYRYRDAGGHTIVEAWHVQGLGHAYPNGDPAGSYTDPKGPDITSAGFQFFDRIGTTATP